LSAGDYEVGVLDGNNCYGFFNIMLNNPPERPININRSSLPGDSIVSLGESLQLEVQSTFTYDSVNWTSDFEIECLNPPLCDVIRIQPTQTGEIAVEVQDDGGCTSRTSTLIRVSTALNVFVPEAFSPNGDGINDYFTIYSNQIQMVQRLQIFDRWGNRLFVLEDFEPGIENLGWDGTSNDKALNPGVYVFSAEVRYLNGEERVVKGDVTLVK
jgi:gliding motility-associated-like protein